MLCYSKGKKKRVWGSEGSHYREPHDLGLPAVARGYSGTAPLPTDAEDICRRVQALWKSPACSQLEPCKALGKAAARSRLPPAEQERQLCPKYPFLQAALARKAKRRLKHQEELCPGNLQEDKAFSQSSTVLPPSRGQAHPLHAVGMPTLFLRGTQGRTNHFHRLNTTPGLRHQYPS